MAALAADLNVSAVGTPETASFSANAADTYYQGAVVWIDTGGGVQVTWAAGDRAIGISPKKQVIAAAGDPVEVVIHGNLWMPLWSSAAVTEEGEFLVNDATNTDNIADLVAASAITPAANDALVGRILRYTSSKGLIAIYPGLTGSLYAATAGWHG